MNYEKEYKLLKAGIRKAYLYAQTDSTKAVLETILPELKESEDERIMKEIAEFIYNAAFKPKDIKKKEKWLTWLEKQGEQKPIWHNEDEEPKKGSLILLIMQSGTPIVAKIIESNHTFNHGERWAYIDDLLEKEGEKPADKVEPKFHEGDWVVYNNDICQIVKREEGCNKLVTVFGIEKELVNERNLSTARLWTIQDAKDGDVLVRNNDMLSICIFSHFDGIYNKFSSFLCHCGLEGEGLGQELSINGYHDDSKNYLPATKEQRDLLFQKMKEAGYEWDAEMKELKKIEQKSAWSEEDEINLQGVIAEIEANKNHAPDYDIATYDRFLSWLKSLKDRVGCEANCTTMWKPSESRFGEAKEAEEADKSKT